MERTTQPKNYIIEQALNNPIQAIRDLGGLSLYEYLQVMWEVIVPDKLKLNWHMELICDELQTVAERVAEQKPKQYDLIFNVPPGSTKTIICMTMFQSWCWTRWYWMQFVTGSYSMPIALKSATKCRDLVKSEKYHVLFPELGIKEDEDNKSDFRVIKKEQVYPGQAARIHHGGGRFTTSVDSGVTGTHGHIIMVDDPINPKQAISPTSLATANNWMDQTLSTRKVDKEVTPTILIMQRLHQDDPTGHLLNKKDKPIRHICLPGEVKNYSMYVKPKELINNYTPDGLLDPNRLTWNALRELEADLGQYGYAGQVGQHPTPPEGGMFKVDHLRIITECPLPTAFTQIIRYWDKAGTHKGGCYTVGVKMGKLIIGKYVVIDVVRGQWSTEERERIIRETAEADGRNVFQYIEQEGGSGGKESAENTVRNLGGYNVIADNPQGDKVSRADPYSVQVNWGNVLLLQGEWNNEYKKELKDFPFGKYKDQVDGSSGAFNKLAAKREAGRII